MMAQVHGIFSASGQGMFATKHDRLRNDLTAFYKEMIDSDECRSQIQNIEEDVYLPYSYVSRVQES